MGNLFDNALTELRESTSARPKDPPPQINIIEGTPDPRNRQTYLRSRHKPIHRPPHNRVPTLSIASCSLFPSLRSMAAISKRDLRDENLSLSEMDDILLKIALTSTIDDGIKVGVAECKSGLDGFHLISDTFTLRSRSAHLGIIRDLLDLRFNLQDKSADLDSHFRKIENLVKQLTRSDFQVTEESLTGLFFQLSLPNPESYPFVNVSRQLDFRMEAGNYRVNNADLLRIAKTELALYRQSKKSNYDRKPDRSYPNKPDGSNPQNKTPSNTSPAIPKWCPKCRSRDHASADCPKNTSSTGSSNTQRAATAPPRPTFTIQSAEAQDNSVSLLQPEDPTIQSITPQQLNPDVTQAEMDWLMKNGATLFGLDSCASHTFTNNLNLLSDCITLRKPIPLITATNTTTSFVTVVGKMTLINKTGSITINNVYFSPDATSTLLSAECLRLGGGNIEVDDSGNVGVRFSSGFCFQSFSINRRWQVPAIVRPGSVPLVFVPPIKVCNIKQSESTCLSAEIALKTSDALLWHRRLGHISLKRIIKMCAAGKFPGLPDRLTNKDFVCEDCLMSKSKRDRQRLSNNERLQPMDVIVSDVLGPFVESFMGMSLLEFSTLH
ncbi:uncharacterized protein VP01_1154g5 [Puccinia sorghi]|uniref:GAG-pre-integrase domain-containing protein n=1 Tax=Puccinia sorghi TaxID=27349 RepID=A0A0L6VT38_9BASI|nr:uncharacterized protein VP01_1154g5 [Puccinia sorghi]